MRLRVRGPNGVSTIALDETATMRDLRSEISAKTLLPAFDIKSGFPPKLLDLDQFDDALKLADCDVKLDGEQLIAIPRSIAEPLTAPLKNTEPPPQAEQRLPPGPNVSAPTSKPPPAPPASTTDPASDPPEIPVPSLQSTLALRVMPDDNSCLFRALSSAVLGSSLDSVTELRSLVASQIQANPELYSKAVLEKDPSAYCRWIQREDAWGGAIELGILAQQFDIEICSINVQDLRVDRFNEGKQTRCILVYSGIHYDVVALSSSEPPHTKTDLPAEFDRKVFDSDEDAVLAAAQELCAVLQKRHYYTDTAGFSIKCNVCGWKGTGEKGATQHARETGHYDFGESS